MRNLKAVILAAGIASRLRPLTDSTPKCLLDLGGATLLERTLQGLRANGIIDVVIVTGYLEEQIHTFVRDRASGMKVQFLTNRLYATTNNIYSLWQTRTAIERHSILLLDSDILFDPDIIRLCLNSGHVNCLALKSGIILGTEEIKVRTDAHGVVKEISKEVEPASAAGESIGIELFSEKGVASLFDILHQKMVVRNQVNQFYEAAFQEAIDSGTVLHAVDVGTRLCMEIDTLDDLQRARELVTG
jgi:choline kinase